MMAWPRLTNISIDPSSPVEMEDVILTTVIVAVVRRRARVLTLEQTSEEL